VTTTCFPNLEVVHTAGEYRGKYPFEIGPTFVHTNREANNYVNFFEVLKKKTSGCHIVITNVKCGIK
jgi:hypothetical protein